MDMTQISVSEPVKMDGPHNFRDLGGYPAKDGTTRKGWIFRSDGLGTLSDADRNWMMEHGITCVLDLRSEREMEHTPDKLNESFEYHAIPMSDRMNSSENGTDLPDRLSDLYIQILDCYQDKFREIAETLVNRKGKPAVFHCAVGKDRTGVTAMLLLKLAGVPEEVILQDYTVSENNMKEIFDQQRELLRQAGWKVPDGLFRSPKEEMERTIRHLKETWGSAEEYFKDCGVLEDELSELKGYLVEKD